MQLALNLFPATDGLDVLIEESMPWLMAWAFVLAVILVLFVGAQLFQRLRYRSPVDKLLRRRFG